MFDLWLPIEVLLRRLLAEFGLERDTLRWDFVVDFALNRLYNNVEIMSYSVGLTYPYWVQKKNIQTNFLWVECIRSRNCSVCRLKSFSAHKNWLLAKLSRACSFRKCFCVASFLLSSLRRPFFVLSVKFAKNWSLIDLSKFTSVSLNTSFFAHIFK